MYKLFASAAIKEKLPYPCLIWLRLPNKWNVQPKIGIHLSIILNRVPPFDFVDSIHIYYLNCCFCSHNCLRFLRWFCWSHQKYLDRSNWISQAPLTELHQEYVSGHYILFRQTCRTIGLSNIFSNFQILPTLKSRLFKDANFPEK